MEKDTSKREDKEKTELKKIEEAADKAASEHLKKEKEKDAEKKKKETDADKEHKEKEKKDDA